MSFPEYGPHRPLSPSQQRQQRSTLVPSGFECVAHPVFFRNSELSPAAAAPTAASATAERRRLDTAASTPTTTISQTATAAWDVETLAKDGNFGADALGGAEGKGVGGVERSEAREVDTVCPICLDKFERPVTLTSCLHSFCHTCILGWYEHTVAVALSQGDVVAFQSERGGRAINSTRNSGGNNSSSSSSSSSSSRRPVPYRCPLCQVPGPFFLSVEPATAADKKNASNGKSKPSKLKFRLLGARTVFGGGGPTSGGVTVDEHPGGGERAEDGGGAGYPSPTMGELRAAVRIQLALASPTQAAEAGARKGAGATAKKKSQPPVAGKKRVRAASGESEESGASGDLSSTRTPPRPVGGDRDGEPRRHAGGGSASSSSISSSRSGNGSRAECAAGVGGAGGDEVGEGESPILSARRRRHSRRRRDVDLDQRGEGAASGDGGLGSSERSAAGGQGATRHDSAIPGARSEGRSSGTHRTKRKVDGRRKGRKKRKSRDSPNGRPSSGHTSSGGGSSSGTGARLPWEPGAMVAEDGLALIEAMLEKEKESLRRKTTLAGDLPS